MQVSIVVLTGMVIPQFPGLDSPQHESKRCVDLKASRLSFENLLGCLLELVNVEIMQSVVKTVLHSVVHVFPSSDGAVLM